MAFNSTHQAAFQPTGNTVSVTAGTSSGNVQVRSIQGQIYHLRVFNDTAVKAFVKFGADNTVVATTTADVPVPAGGVEVFTTAHSWAAVILPSDSGNVYFTPGDGL